MKTRDLLRVHAFSEDRRYRYTLWRDWSDDVLELEERAGNHTSEFVQFIGLNPSTADETKDDPTLRKCIGFAKRWGYGAMCMTNLFAFRATDPREMKRQLEPVGGENEPHIRRIAKEAGLVVAAWGVHGTHGNMDMNLKRWMAEMEIPLKCLRLTKHGHPEHPLYVPYETPLIDFSHEH